MERIYHVGKCPVCRDYGRMEVLYSLSSEKCFVMCEECLLEFSTVDDYKNEKNGNRSLHNNLAAPLARPATPEEIEHSEWYSILTDKP